MMPDLPQIYDESFFREWGSKHKKYIDSAKVITDLIMELVRPSSLIDLGCGCGVYSHFFKNSGVKVVSVDGVQPPREQSFDVPIQIHDLTEPITNKWGEFDVTLCLEVAEHIPENLIHPFIKNITQFSSNLILSAAPPNQGGHHHVNEQPKRYWVQKLAEGGFAYNRRKTGVFIEKFKVSGSPYKWIGEHISFYERLKKSGSNKRELPFATRISS